MNETGIIRRLDALGRIVIPREFRKLNRIEVGDPLEMRALADGEIVVRKVDLSAELKTMGNMALSALATYTDKPAAVCSQESWLAASGMREGAGDELPESVAESVRSGEEGLLRCADAKIPVRRKLAAVYPVAGETGVFGALVLFTDEEPTDTERALMQALARFTGSSLQKF